MKDLNLSSLHKAVRDPAFYMLALFAGMAVLVFRNPDPFVNHIIYTEDGSWVGLALSEGWLHTFINAKDGYFVWGNLLLLNASVTASQAFCGNALTCLPQSIAVFSYAFFSSVALLAFYVTRGVLPLVIRWFIFAGLLLMPLGDSSNEIIGRLSNIGYLFVFICVLMFFVRDNLTPRLKFAVDVLIILSAATNPVCIPLVAMFLVLNTVNKYRSGYAVPAIFKDGAFLLGGISLLVVAILTVFSDGSGSQVSGEFEIDSFIEVSIARSLLYPFVFWLYSSLSDEYTVLLFVFFCFLFVYMYSLTDCNRIKTLVLMSLFALALFLVMTLIMRPSLTQQLVGYQTTFPDRYFMGLNCIVLFVFLALSGRLFYQGGFRRLIGSGVLVYVFAIYMFNLSWLIESESPRMEIAVGPSFNDSICLAMSEQEDKPDALVTVPTYFEGWSMQAPYQIVKNAYESIDCTKAMDSFFLTDANWVNGISRFGPVFFVPNKPPFSDDYKVGRIVNFLDGQSRLIVGVEHNGKYINVHVDGGLIDAGQAGLPNYFDVEEKTSLR